jgi:predicted nucleotide-binding protein (sugar kinase/HSP70/actin superfamily)
LNKSLQNALHFAFFSGCCLETEVSKQLYWSFGTYILASAKTIAAKAGLYAVYPSYHGCGPDGILSHWFEDEAGGKPYLSLEIDEHASKVGVITRLEAFVNSVYGYEKSASQREQAAPAASLMRDTSG